MRRSQHSNGGGNGPYPYRIPSTDDVTNAELKAAARHFGPQQLNEFLRIEALLRCQIVQRVFFKKGLKGFLDLLAHKYGFPLNPLACEHHLWRVLPATALRDKGFGEGHIAIADLEKDIWTPREYLEKHPEIEQSARRLFGEQKSDRPPASRTSSFIDIDMDSPPRLLNSMRRWAADPKHPFLFLRLDTSFPPEQIIKALRPLLAERHKLSKKYVGQSKDTSIYKVKNWLKYFKCYDLRQADANISFGQIALKVYPDSKGEPAYRQAQQGCRRAEKAIRDAELGGSPFPQM